MKIFIPVLFCVVFIHISFSYAQVSLDVETGMVLSGYNDVRIPGDGGTLISLAEELSTDSQFFYRIRLNWRIRQRHCLSLLFAPLSLNASGSVEREVVFEDVTFPARETIDALFRFNSYRLTYRNEFIRRPRVVFGLGATIKIRDAEVRFRSDARSDSKTNIGLVPLINFRLRWMLNRRWALLLEGDGLAAPQGRAEDMTAALLFRANPRWTFRIGYRVLEGGADVDEVYNFTWLNYWLLGIEGVFGR